MKTIDFNLWPVLCIMAVLFLGCEPTRGDKASKAEHSHFSEELKTQLDAKDRDEWQDPEIVLNLLGNLKDKTVLDLGSGTGYFAFKLVDAGAKVIAADTDDEFLQIIREKREESKIPRERLELRKIPLDSPGMRAQEIDLALVVDTYHHIESRPRYFGKLREGLKPHGKLVVVDYKKDKTIIDGPPYEIRLTPEAVERELREAGFSQILSYENLLSRQFVLLASTGPSARKSGSEFMKEFWNEAYAKEEYLFGTEPDRYFKKILPQFEKGALLLPAEGEGRNAVFAAQLGWDVTAFDYSVEAKKKADKLAERNNVAVDYSVVDIINAEYPSESFDAVGLLFVHFEGQERQEIHRKLDRFLKPGGILIIEAFSTEHPKYNSGGPQKESQLYSENDIKRDFPDYEILELKIERDSLKEGKSLMEDCSVLRFVGRKK